jgi:hypothetical protein
MTLSDNSADDIARSLRGVTKAERAFARDRLTKFYDGGLPQWRKQIEITGAESMGYVVIAYLWLSIAGILAIFGSPMAFIGHKSGFLSALEVATYSLVAVLILVAVTRYLQGIKVGRIYRSSNLH